MVDTSVAVATPPPTALRIRKGSTRAGRRDQRLADDSQRERGARRP